MALLFNKRTCHFLIISFSFLLFTFYVLYIHVIVIVIFMNSESLKTVFSSTIQWLRLQILNTTCIALKLSTTLPNYHTYVDYQVRYLYPAYYASYGPIFNELFFLKK